MVSLWDSVHRHLESHSEWSNVDATSDVINLLKVIQVCMVQCQTRKLKLHSLYDAESTVYSFQQSNHMSNHDYYEKFKDNLMTVERLGSQLGQHDTRVQQFIQQISADPTQPTEAERKLARNKAKDGYLAVCFLMNSDKRRYGALICDIENEHTRGTNSYPTTLTATYDYLVN